MLSCTVQTGHTITLPHPPARIISLVPSQTELLYDLGLNEQVAGITKFCIHPEEWFRTKTRVGGTKQLKMDIIHRLQPDLIIANKEENVKEQIEELAKSFPVWTSDISNLSDALAMITAIGLITGKEKEAASIVKKITDNFATLPKRTLRKAVYLIWQKPFMCAGGDTFISSMMETAGFANVFTHKKRYPELTPDEIAASEAEYILLSSEPFPFKQKHRDEIIALFPAQEVILVDGELFSWYGSRLLHAPEYFGKL
ncbi:MAG: ABC transporter substrate-binding protein [Chitinophagaceae bacterium]|nr:ABC transporter substrate-binding protein [Chitinophagaceae bacterium]